MAAGQTFGPNRSKPLQPCARAEPPLAVEGHAALVERLASGERPSPAALVAGEGGDVVAKPIPKRRHVGPSGGPRHTTLSAERTGLDLRWILKDKNAEKARAHSRSITQTLDRGCRAVSLGAVAGHPPRRSGTLRGAGGQPDNQGQGYCEALRGCVGCARPASPTAASSATFRGPTRTAVGIWGQHDRGVSWTFGLVVERFCNFICRARQVVEEGCQFFSQRRLITVFSGFSTSTWVSRLVGEPSGVEVSKPGAALTSAPGRENSLWQ